MVLKLDHSSEYSRSIEGVEIFASGTHTDSSGFTREWSKADLDAMVRNSKDNGDPIPLKVGHSSDTFNQKLADELGVPTGLLTGENGSGAARLGIGTNIRREDDKLVADFTNIPDPLADLIETGQFNAVSVEIDVNDDDDLNLSAIALLGAELPAVDSLAPLTSKLSAPGSAPWITLSFNEGIVDIEEITAEFEDIQTRFEEIIRGKKGARLFRTLAAMLSDRFNSMTGKSKNQAPIYGQGQGNEDGRPSKAWWDRAITAARAYQLSDPIAFAGSVWFNDDPIPRASFDTPETSIQAAAALHSVIAAWQTTHQHHHSEDDNIMTQQHKFQINPETDLPMLYEALGLDETATIEDILAAIEALKAGEAPPGPEGEGEGAPAPMAPMSQPDPQIAALQEQLASQGAYIKNLEHERMVISYQSKVKDFLTVTDAPALAEELATTQETLGQEAADRLVAAYQRSHEAAQESGLLQSIGTPSKKEPGSWDDDSDEFHQKIEEYAKEKGVSFQKAMADMAAQHPAEFRQYRARVEATVYSNGH